MTKHERIKSALTFAGVEITQATILRTREHFAEIYRECIRQVERGELRVADEESFFAWQNQMLADVLAGEHDHTFTFAQRAHWLQTGECVPLFKREA